MDGLLEVASTYGRVDTEAPEPQTSRQQRMRDDLDHIFDGKMPGTRQRMNVGDFAEVSAADSSSGMDDLVAGPSTHRRLGAASQRPTNTGAHNGTFDDVVDSFTRTMRPKKGISPVLSFDFDNALGPAKKR